MESDLKAPVFIEFYGLPGCGKSTIAHALANELQRQGRKVNEPSYDMDHKYSRLLRKIYKFVNLLMLIVAHNNLHKNLIQLIKENGYKKHQLIFQEINLAYKMRSYLNGNRFEFIIFDEGLIQSAMSLSMKGALSPSDNVLRLLEHVPVAKNYYIKTDMKENFSRLILRNTFDSRIDRISDNAVKETVIRELESRFDQINKSLNSQIIDGNQSIHENVVKIHTELQCR